MRRTGARPRQAGQLYRTPRGTRFVPGVMITDGLT